MALRCGGGACPCPWGQRPVGYVYPEGGYMYLNEYPVHLVVSCGYAYPDVYLDVYPDVSQCISPAHRGYMYRDVS